MLTRYPDLKSIGDVGRLIGNPWKDRFFTLLGKPQTLDGIEHETMRAPGAYDEPRVPVTVNCASIGCPLLSNRALTVDGLDGEREDLMRRYLADRTRNRYKPKTGRLEPSMIFNWYGEAFRRGGRNFLRYAGLETLPQLGACDADLFAEKEAERPLLRVRSVTAAYLEYDWRPNAVEQR